MINKISLVIKKYHIYLEFLIIALFILFPVLKNGYIFLIDSVFTPKLPWLWDWQSPFFFWWLLVVFFSKIVGSVIVEKIIYLAIIFFTLLGAYKLPDTKNQWVRYFAAFFYLFNPFVYSRFLFGQIWVLLAYSLLPFLLKSFLNFLNGLEKKYLWRIVLFSSLISILDIRFVLFIALLIFVGLFFAILFKLKDRQYIKKIFTSAVQIIFLFFLLNSYWVIPILMNKSAVSELINQQIDQRHLSAFRTAFDQKYGVVWNTAAMYGFWGDREDRYAIQKEMVPYWFELYILILIIAIWGVWCGLKKKKDRLAVVILTTVGVISLILAVGIAYKPFEFLVVWLNKNIPFYKGYREPQKWVSVLILSYVYLGSISVQDLIPRIKSLIKKKETRDKNFFIPTIVFLKNIVPLLFIIIPLLYSPGMLWGFKGQMFTSSYPTGWFKVNDFLNKDRDSFQVLFLPWHQYMGFSFAGRVINNPAERFFDKPVIAGDNIEMGAIYTQNNNPNSKYVEKNILRKKNINNLGERLSFINIKYVIFAKEADYFNYVFLEKQNDLEVVYEDENLRLYKNLKWKITP